MDNLVKIFCIALMVLCVVISIVIWLLVGDSPIVCHLNPHDATDVFCYQLQ